MHATPTLSFSLVADKRQTIEYLGQQIEAEYTYRYLIPSQTTEAAEEPNLNYEPIECGVLYDACMNPLRFESTVGDVLNMDEEVHVVNVYEGRHVWRSITISVADGPTTTASTAPTSPTVGTSTRGLKSVTSLRTGEPTPRASTRSGFTLPSDSSDSSTELRYPSVESVMLSQGSMRSLAPVVGMRAGGNLIVNPTLDDRMQAVLGSRNGLEAFMHFWWVFSVPFAQLRVLIARSTWVE